MRAWPNAPRSSKPRRPAQAAPAAPQRASSSVERAALAAIAAAVAPEAPQPAAPLQPASYGDVTVRPIAQKPTLFPDHRRRPRRDPGAGDARDLHPAGRRASAGPRARGCRSSRTCRCRPRPKFARPAAKPRRSIRRRPGCRCCSASPMSASAAATKRPSRRSRPARPVRRWRRCRRCRSASPQRTVAQQIASQRAGIGICPAARAAGIGRPWPPGTCCRGATGRRSFGYPGLPAPPVQLKFVTILTDAKGPGWISRDLFFGACEVAALLAKQLILND